MIFILSRLFFFFFKAFLADLRANFEGECSEVGMYLAMARVAHREGYPEIGMYYEKAAYEEAEHAAKFAELLGEVVTDSTEKNLQMRVEAENGATAGKFDLAKRAKAADLDAIHDTVHEMAKDEARHVKAFAGLLKRYFGNNKPKHKHEKGTGLPGSFFVISNYIHSDILIIHSFFWYSYTLSADNVIHP